MHGTERSAATTFEPGKADLFTALIASILLLGSRRRRRCGLLIVVSFDALRRRRISGGRRRSFAAAFAHRRHVSRFNDGGGDIISAARRGAAARRLYRRYQIFNCSRNRVGGSVVVSLRRITGRRTHAARILPTFERVFEALRAKAIGGRRTVKSASGSAQGWKSGLIDVAFHCKTYIKTST